MHNIKTIRDDPESFDLKLARRGIQPQSKTILMMDSEWRQLKQSLEQKLATKKRISKEIGDSKRGISKNTAIASELSLELVSLKSSILADETQEQLLSSEIHRALSGIPNLPADDVPEGNDETGNIEVKRVGVPKSFDFAVKHHFELGEALGLMDFETASKLSGSRFVVLKGQLARLERALGSFMLDVHSHSHGYTETNPPLLVRDKAVFGTGNLPKFEDDLFKVTGEYYLTPTAEVSVTNYVSDHIMAENHLPLRYVAQTQCFRSESGSAGRDTRGMIRMHQFTKVELVSIVTPESSDAEHERMTRAAEIILERLNLPYRRMLLCSGDMGFSAKKTYDLEVWLPGQNSYREISSCSNCGDFQARRMGARLSNVDGKGTRFVHTLNGSGVAVGRCLVAVLENYQNADGSITVPAALRPYMGSLEKIG